MIIGAARIVTTFHVFKLLTNDDLAVLRLRIDLRVLGRARRTVALQYRFEPLYEPAVDRLVVRQLYLA